MTRNLLSLFLLLSACSDPGATPDAGATADAGSTSDAGATADAGGSPDSGARADAGSGATPCETGSATAMIGTEGGSVELCGASISVLPGTVTEPTEFRIDELGAYTGALPYELAPASSVFRFAASATRLSNFLRITIPHSATGRTIVPFAVAEDGELVSIEACSLDDRGAVIDTVVLGPYVVFYETYDYPDEVGGLGSGTMAATFIDDIFTYDLDTTPHYAVRFEGYETHGIELHTTHDGTPSRRLIVHLLTDPLGGSPRFVRASYTTVSGPDVTLWESEDEADLELTSTGAHAHRGTVRVMMRNTASTDRVETSIDLDFATEKWRWPPELACAIGHE